MFISHLKILKFWQRRQKHSQDANHIKLSLGVCVVLKWSSLWRGYSISVICSKFKHAKCQVISLFRLDWKKKDLHLWLDVVRTAASFQILAGPLKAAIDQEVTSWAEGRCVGLGMSINDKSHTFSPAIWGWRWGGGGVEAPTAPGTTYVPHIAP